MDVVACGGHGGEHRLMGARPVDQDAGAVAIDQRRRRARRPLDGGRRRAAGLDEGS